jgi:signal transduction histidine kinase/HD-like signal output (HDOD) protein
MLNMNQHSTESKIDLDYTRLPAAPHVLIKLIDLFHQSDVSFEALEAIIEKDTALCSKVISISNSAAYSQWGDVRDLKRILVVLGTKTIKSIALTSAVHQFFSQFSKELGETLGSLWLDALICAHLSRRLASLTGFDDPDEAHLAGLMHQLGQLIFLSNDPQQYQELIASVTDQHALMYREQQLYGIQSTDLAADVIATWGIDSFLHDAVRYQHQPAELLLDAPPLVKLVNLASQLCNRLNHSHQKFLVEDHFFGLNQSIIDNLVLQATESAIADARSFGVEVDEDPTIPLANIDDEAIRIELARRVRDIALLDGVQQHINEVDDISDMMQLVTENLQLLFGLNSMLFFFPDHEQSKLIGISSHSKNLPADGAFTISLQPQRSLIADAALQKKVLDSQQQNTFEIMPVIDRQVKDVLMLPHFICIPLLSNDELMGVVVAGCNDGQAERLHRETDLLQHFATIIADSLAHQKKLQQEFQQRQQLQQQEANLQMNKIIHEVNNPLTIINNYLEILSLDLSKESNNKKHLETIKSEVDRVAEILLQLKDSQETEPVDHPEVDVNQLVNNLLDIFKPTFYKLNQIQSRVKLDPALPPICTDQNKLKQILTNLLKNAAEALPERGLITIRSKALVIVDRKKYIEITVSDNGSGIPDAILENLFTPVTTAKGQSHSGLGLTIVNKLVSELKGSISYSTADEGGAQFIILLPRH